MPNEDTNTERSAARERGRNLRRLVSGLSDPPQRPMPAGGGGGPSGNPGVLTFAQSPAGRLHLVPAEPAPPPDDEEMALANAAIQEMVDRLYETIMFYRGRLLDQRATELEGSAAAERTEQMIFQFTAAYERISDALDLVRGQVGSLFKPMTASDMRRYMDRLPEHFTERRRAERARMLASPFTTSFAAAYAQHQFDAADCMPASDSGVAGQASTELDAAYNTLIRQDRSES